jgi:hypothetical protein
LHESNFVNYEEWFDTNLFVTPTEFGSLSIDSILTT